RGIAPIIATDTALKEAFGIRLSITQLVVVQLDNNNANFSLMATSIECPPPQIYSPLQSIDSIKIITITNLDALHPSGADVTNKFRGLSNYVTIDETVQYLNGHSIFVEQDQLGQYIDLYLIDPPIQSQMHQFRLELYFSDGTILVDQTQPIFLQ
ncbi:MAG: DUF5034 domain-containing protein, partial [Cyclobacteriaceae bacterium]|nr:DUF5034 domain-containing protein [Cyclobacteriaceae bacterium]